VFRPKKHYRHEDCTDVDIEVWGIAGESASLVTLIVVYWNHRYSCYCGSQECISIRKEDMHKWKEIKQKELS